MIRTIAFNRAALLVGLALAGLIAPGTLGAQEGGIEIFAGETIFARGTRVSLSYVEKERSDLFRGSDEETDPLSRRFTEDRWVLGFDYGLAPGISLSALIPYVNKSSRSTVAPGVRNTSRGQGLGDAAILGKLRLYQQDWPRGTWAVALIGGVETPTGETREKDDGVRLPPGLQPGTGAWNPFIAIGTNASFDRIRLDGSVFYKANLEGAQNFEKGDFLSVSFAAKYRFLHRKYPGPTAGIKLGLQYRHEERAEQDGATVDDSGSDVLLLRPGFSMHPGPGIDVSITYDFPVAEHYRGTQLGFGRRIFIAVGIRF